MQIEVTTPADMVVLSANVHGRVNSLGERVSRLGESLADQISSAHERVDSHGDRLDSHAERLAKLEDLLSDKSAAPTDSMRISLEDLYTAMAHLESGNQVAAVKRVQQSVPGLGLQDAIGVINRLKRFAIPK